MLRRVIVFTLRYSHIENLKRFKYRVVSMYSLRSHILRIKLRLSGNRQTLGMREGITSGHSRANFPRKIVRENIRNKCCLAKKSEGKLECSQKSVKETEIRKEEENTSFFELKASSSTDILLIYHSVLSLNKKAIRF